IFRKNKIFCERVSIMNHKMKYLALLTVLLIFKVHEINATSVTIPGYTYWIKCLTTDQTKSSTQISYDITSKNGTTPSTYSAPTTIDMSGFGYEYSYLQHASILDAVLMSYSGPTFTVSSSTTPVDLGGFFVYLLDNSRSPTADPLCGSTTSFVGSCTQQKSDLNSDWLFPHFTITWYCLRFSGEEKPNVRGPINLSKRIDRCLTTWHYEVLMGPAFRIEL
ncbi:14943_t:CDS:2, partial [Dentiscutata heterogama]